MYRPAESPSLERVPSAVTRRVMSLSRLGIGQFVRWNWVCVAGFGPIEHKLPNDGDHVVSRHYGGNQGMITTDGPSRGELPNELPDRPHRSCAMRLRNGHPPGRLWHIVEIGSNSV